MARSLHVDSQVSHFLFLNIITLELSKKHLYNIIQINRFQEYQGAARRTNELEV